MENEELVAEVKKIGEDLNGKITQVEGQMKQAGKISEDTLRELENIGKKYSDVEELCKKQGTTIEALTVRINRDNTLSGGHSEKQKGYYEQIKSGLGEVVTKAGFGKAMKGFTSFEIKEGQGAMHQKTVGDMSNTNLSGGYASIDIRPMIVSAPYRKRRVRGLINVGTISSPIMQYMKNTGGEGGVGFQTEGSLKSQVDFDLTMVTEDIKTIAVFAVVTKQMLADVPRLANFLSNQMTNKWFDFEDDQIINGDNIGDNFNGLLNQATNYTPTNGTENTYFEYLVDAIAQLENTNFEASGIVMNPLDFVSLLTYKSSTGEFNHPGLIYGADNILRIYGTEIVKNNAIAKGKGLVGDFTQAELLVHDGLSFDMSYEDSDNFRKNKVTLRLEAREGFAVYQPTAFRELDFTGITGV